MPHFKAELVPAMVTPFTKDEKLDLRKFEELALHLIENGCDGLLVNGTTGESPTLTPEEKITLLKTVKQVTAGKKDAITGLPIQIMSGIGSNNTAKTVEEAQKTAEVGVDALLVVVPYYSKPSQRGMFEHFSQVALAVSNTNIVIYNIPGRCGTRMTAETMVELNRAHPNIIGVKQSYADMDAASEITALLPADNWLTWCGDDTLTVPMMATGAHGTISVLAHLAGGMMREMIQAVKANDRDKALKLHLKLLHFGQELFFLPNPTVVKTCLSELGMMDLVFRSPMIAPDKEEHARINTMLAKLKALQPQLA